MPSLKVLHLKCEQLDTISFFLHSAAMPLNELELDLRQSPQQKYQESDASEEEEPECVFKTKLTHILDQEYTKASKKTTIEGIYKLIIDIRLEE